MCYLLGNKSPLCLVVFVPFAITGQTVPLPKVRGTFSAVLDRSLVTTIPHIIPPTPPTQSVFLVDEANLTVVTSPIFPGGRRVYDIEAYRERKWYQVEPFFSGQICYMFDQPHTGANATDMFLAETELPQEGIEATKGPSSSVDGKSCDLYFIQDPDGTSNLTLCIAAGGHLLMTNKTEEGWFLKKFIAVTTNVYLNYSEIIDPNVMIPPVLGCVNLTNGPGDGQRILSERTQVNDASHIAAVQAAAGDFWHAGRNSVFDGASFEDVRREKLGTKMGALHLPLAPHAYDSTGRRGTLPVTFDARLNWPGCGSLGQIRNQGSCGSCWAFAASEVFADRVCIGGGDKNASFAVEYIVDCDKMDLGCDGGFLDSAWHFLKDTGLPPEGCDPYKHCPYPEKQNCKKPGFGAKQFDVPSLSSCPSQCSNGRKIELLRVSSAYAVAKPGDMATMQHEILSRGPIEVAFFVYTDFMNYKNGTYFRTSAATGPVGAHAVRILGWGMDSAHMPYWMVANSWGPEWGNHGFFQIRRGTNECGIETTPAAGEYTPDLPIQNIIV